MLEIRKVSAENIHTIRTLALTTWPVAYGDLLPAPQLEYMLNLFYSETSLTNQIENLNHQFIIIYENNIAVGFASYSPKQADIHDIYRLHKLYVLPNQQGKGTGKLLLDFIVAEIKQAGASILELNVKRDNPAIHFYKKFGFTIAKEMDIDIGSGYFMVDYIMEKQILL